MSERLLLAEIAKICGSLNPPVRWVHYAAVRRDRSCPWLVGMPDVLLVGSRSMCWREVKAASTPLTAARDHWLDVLEAAGGDADIWQERDLYDGSIRAEIYGLNGIAVLRATWIPDGATPEEAAGRAGGGRLPCG
jgi:hypothetical protein